MYRHEMNCQIIHDSIHARLGWTHEYLLTEGAPRLVMGPLPWPGRGKRSPTMYEYFVLPQHRGHIFDLFFACSRRAGRPRSRRRAMTRCSRSCCTPSPPR